MSSESGRRVRRVAIAFLYPVLRRARAGRRDRPPRLGARHSASEV